jgi:hypothetical protein
MADRTTKFLLVAIALALWGLLLRPTITPIPAQAQGEGSSTTSSLVVTDRDVYFRSGYNIYRFERNLQLKDQAKLEVVNGETKYVHRGP